MPFDPAAMPLAAMTQHRFGGHGGRLGLRYHARGDDWVELALPYAAALAGDADDGVLASGPIIAMMDVATSLAVWHRIGAFVPHATLDLRIDHLRPPRPGATIVGRGECLRIARTTAFTRGLAHDGDPDDPVAHVAATFMVPSGTYPGAAT